MKLNFIIIDDSELDCFIAEKLIQYTGKAGSMRSFTEASPALEYIEKEVLPPDDKSTTVILLDILMPVMSGFEFLNIFEELPAPVRDRYFVVAITSSLNKNDILKIKSYDSVKGVIDKPVTIEALSEIFERGGLDWTEE